MMDMFTIILVFLLKSYSAEGVLVTPAEGLHIPNSQTQASLKPALEIKISKTEIAVGSQVVAKIATEIKSEDFAIAGLVEHLKMIRGKSKMMSESLGEEHKADLVIQGDRDMPYKILTKVMYSCGQAGYNKQSFVAYQQE